MLLEGTFVQIGELAKSAACKVETIRFYEKAGLLPKPPRTEGNYRSYNKGHAERLHFVRHCRALGMNLEEIRVIASFQDRPESGCGAVNSIIDTQIGRITDQIEALQKLEKTLRRLRKACRSEQATRDCGILRDLASCSICPSCVAATDDNPATAY
jgi:Cd(II)/Pb(II)-responsive transcriptional regulator